MTIDTTVCSRNIPSKGRHYRAAADASSVGFSAMLLQSREAGNTLRLIYCTSKKTSEPESTYHSSKLELMCVV